MQNTINLGFIQQLRMLRLDRFQFNGDFFARGHVGTQINVTKRSAANLAAEPVLFPHAEFHLVMVVVVIVLACWFRSCACINDEPIQIFGKEQSQPKETTEQPPPPTNRRPCSQKDAAMTAATRCVGSGTVDRCIGQSLFFKKHLFLVSF